MNDKPLTNEQISDVLRAFHIPHHIEKDGSQLLATRAARFGTLGQYQSDHLSGVTYSTLLEWLQIARKEWTALEAKADQEWNEKLEKQERRKR